MSAPAPPGNWRACGATSRACPNPTRHGGGSCTEEAWVFPTGRTHYAGIVSRVFDTGATESGYGLLLDNGGGFYGAVKPAGQGYQYLSSGAGTLPGSQWHHLAMTWDGQQLTLYVDGEKKAAYACAGTNRQYEPDHELTFGAYRDKDELYQFSGKLAEVRLWNTTRSAKQISDDRYAQPAVSFQGAGYAAAPRVIVGLDCLDFDCRRNLRVNLTAEAISATGMTLNLNSWADTVMYSAGGSYIAIG